MTQLKRDAAMECWFFYLYLNAREQGLHNVISNERKTRALYAYLIYFAALLASIVRGYARRTGTGNALTLDLLQYTIDCSIRWHAKSENSLRYKKLQMQKVTTTASVQIRLEWNKSIFLNTRGWWFTFWFCKSKPTMLSLRPNYLSLDFLGISFSHWHSRRTSFKNAFSLSRPTSPFLIFNCSLLHSFIHSFVHSFVRSLDKLHPPYIILVIWNETDFNNYCLFWRIATPGNSY